MPRLLLSLLLLFPRERVVGSRITIPIVLCVPGQAWVQVEFEYAYKEDKTLTYVLRIVAIFYLLLNLLVAAVFQFAPQQAPRLYHRTLYYLFGSEGAVPMSASAGVRRLVAGWAVQNSTLMGVL